MWAATVAAIYFGTFIAVGIAANAALRRWTGADLADVQAQAGPNRRKRTVFLLGAWRNEE